MIWMLYAICLALIIITLVLSVRIDRLEDEIREQWRRINDE